MKARHSIGMRSGRWAVRTMAAVVLAMAAWPAGRALAAAVTLPVTVSGQNWIWEDIGTDGVSYFNVGEAALLIPSREDAYDGVWQVEVDGNLYLPGTAGDASTASWGRTFTGAPTSLSGLTVTESFSTFCFSPTLRVVVTLTNPSDATIDADVSMLGNLGSDTDTTIEASSTGDTSFTTGDRWLVTSDGTTAEDPINTFVWFGPGSPALTPSGASLSGDQFDVTFSVSIPAGATRRLMFFSQLHGDVSGATSAAATFGTNGATASAGFLSGLTSGELSSLLNWSSLSASTPSIACPACAAQPTGTFDLPLSFVGSEWTWQDFSLSDDFDGALVVEDASLDSNGTDDAYDGFWALNVGGTAYAPSATVDVSSSVGSFMRLTPEAVVISGLEVREEFSSCCDDPTLTVLVTLHNPTGAAISVPLTVSGNLGSDSDTTVEASSSGDQTFSIADRWVVTSDGATASDPINTFMFFGPGDPQSQPTAASISGDGVSVTFQATLPAGATQHYLFFSRLSEDVAQATAGIAHLDGLAARGSCGLAEPDLRALANWEPIGGVNVPALGHVGLALLALALAAAGALATRRP